MSNIPALASTVVVPMHRAAQLGLTPTHVIILSAVAMAEGLTYSMAAKRTPFSIDTLRGNSGPIKHLINEGLLDDETRRSAKRRPEKLLTLTETGTQVITTILTGNK